MTFESLRVAVIGAISVGLAAAAHLVRRSQTGILLVAFLMAAGCADTPGRLEEKGELVPRPEWRVGDRWVFRRTPLAGVVAVVSHQVIDASSGRYTVRISGIAPEVTRTWTGDLHLIQQQAGEVTARFDPPAPYFAWPLRLGKTWTQVFQYTDGRHDGRRTHGWRVGPLVERLDLLDGTYYVLRVEHLDEAGQRLETYWYTPRVRYWVRFESAIGGYTEELVEARLGS